MDDTMELEVPEVDEFEDAPAVVYGYQSLLIRQIRRDGGTQARVGLNEDTVQEYAELMRDHLWDFQSRQRPIVLYDGSAFWLADGFHRIEAAQRAQLSDFPVEVLKGDQRDAILRAAGANSQHGLRRTNADKRRAVELLLKDAEWRQWSDRKIADTCAVDHKTVADVRKSLSGEIPQIETRTVERNGSTYQMTPAAPKPKIPEPTTLPDLSSFGFSVRELPDGRYAIRSPGNLESQHTAAQLNDLIAHWRAYPAIPADLAASGVAWRYRQDKMYQVMCRDMIGHTGYTAAECLASQRDSMERSGQINAPYVPLGTPIALPIPTGDDAADQAALAGSIRELAEPLGLQMIWEDGKVLLYWPDEADDIEQMDLLSYGAALEWLKWEAKGIKADRDERTQAAPDPDPAAPDDRPADNAASYNAKAQRDRERLSRASSLITAGEYGDARRELDAIETEIWQRDRLRSTLARSAALAFHNEQRARLKNFSATAMVSQSTYTQSLDHIEALLNWAVVE